MLADLTIAFPNLVASGYNKTSERSSRYNCIAWSLDDDTRWWEPSTSVWTYWPSQVPNRISIRNMKRLYSLFGYKFCKGRELEEGYEKVVFYVKGSAFKHVAKQLSDGNWTSKLGELVDIRHTLDGLSGSKYGEPKIFLKRELK